MLIDMIEGISQAILLLEPTFDINSIIQGNQNNDVLPTNTNFIIITPLDTYMSGLTGASYYDGITETDNYVALDSTNFQVDFYGTDAARISSSLRLFLTTIQCADFLRVGYNCSVHDDIDQKNMTSDLDRSKYAARWVLRFSLYNNNTVSISSKGFVNADIGIKLAEAYDNGD